jgi:hypothetical protein
MSFPSNPVFHIRLPQFSSIASPAIAAVLALGNPVFANTVTESSQDEPAYTVAGNDLLQTSVASVADSLAVSASYNIEGGGNGASVLADGSFGGADASGSIVIEGGSITYTLDITIAPDGYQIQSIHTYAGWNDTGRDNQQFTVSYATVAQPDVWIPIASVSNDPPQKLNQVSISGIAAVGVLAIRFDFPAQENRGVGYKEFDVFGAPSPPLVDATDYDLWAQSHALAGGVEDDDDGDGLTNAEEYAFGLLPESPSSCNPILTPLDRSSGKFLYARREAGITGFQFSIWTSTDLTGWTEDTGATQAVIDLWDELEIVEATLSPERLSSPTLFVRVKAELPDTTP